MSLRDRITPIYVADYRSIHLCNRICDYTRNYVQFTGAIHKVDDTPVRAEASSMQHPGAVLVVLALDWRLQRFTAAAKTYSPSPLLRQYCCSYCPERAC